MIQTHWKKHASNYRLQRWHGSAARGWPAGWLRGTQPRGTHFICGCLTSKQQTASALPAAPLARSLPPAARRAAAAQPGHGGGSAIPGWAGARCCSCPGTCGYSTPIWQGHWGDGGNRRAARSSRDGELARVKPLGDFANAGLGPRSRLCTRLSWWPLPSFLLSPFPENGHWHPQGWEKPRLTPPSGCPLSVAPQPGSMG